MVAPARPPGNPRPRAEPALTLLSLATMLEIVRRALAMSGPARETIVAEVQVCPLEELPPGAVTAAEIDGTRVCVANVHGQVFAVQDRCPHLFANLSAGELRGASIVCPWHDSEFDMRTGATRKWLPNGLWNFLDRTAPPLPPFLEAKRKPAQIRAFRTRVVQGVIRVSDD